MQDPDRREGYLATVFVKSSILLKGANPRLIDEWQVTPVLWDAVRTMVDQRQEEGLFILTGSTPVDDSHMMHSGTGRISRMKLYPMSLFESKESNGNISLKQKNNTVKFLIAEDYLNNICESDITTVDSVRR